MKLLEDSVDTKITLNEDELVLVTGQWVVEFEDGVKSCLGRMDDVCAYESVYGTIVNVTLGCSIMSGVKTEFSPLSCSRIATSSYDGK